jgi:hypothetical protein
MGIFGSQGEYAKLAPLFVDKFDTEPTFSKINKSLMAGDEQANIDATTAMSHEQGLANMIHQKNQEIIRKVNSGEMSPFKYERLAKETAHNYVNDPVRRNVETSYKANEESIKANKDNNTSYGKMQMAQGYHAAVQGGSEASAMTPWSSAKNFDSTDWASKISNMTNADKEVNGPRVSAGPVGGTLAIAKDDHEFITRQKVADYGRQLLDSDPGAKAYLEEMSYGDLYNQKYAELVNDPNTTGLSEKDKKALIYQHLNTPVKKVYERTVRDKEGKPVKDAKGNIVKEKQEYSISPLQEEVEKRKEQMVNGVAGLTAFDKYDSSLNLSNIPGYGEGKEKGPEQTPTGMMVQHDASDIATSRNDLLDEVNDITEGKNYTITANSIGGGVAAGGTSAGVTSVKDPEERFNLVKNKIVDKLTKYGLDQRELAGISNTEAGRKELANKASQIRTYENLHINVYSQEFSPEQAVRLKNDIMNKRGGLDAVIFDTKTGRPLVKKGNDALDDIIETEGDKVLSDNDRKLSLDAQRNKILENASISGITTVLEGPNKGSLAYKMKIGDRDFYAKIPGISTKSAYTDLNNLNVLQKTPTSKNVPVTSPTLYAALGVPYNASNPLKITKKVSNPKGGTPTLKYNIYDPVTKQYLMSGQDGEGVQMDQLAEYINGVALSSLSEAEIKTMYKTENTKSAGR